MTCARTSVQTTHNYKLSTRSKPNSTSQDNVLFLVVPDSGNVFEPRVLELVRELTKLGWQVPYARRVDSLTNYQHASAIADEISVGDLVKTAGPVSGAAAAHARTVALAQPGLVNRIVAANGSATSVAVSLSISADQLHADDEVIEFARAQVAPLRTQLRDVKILIGGTTATNVALGEAVARDLTSLVIISYLVIAAGLFVLLRHLAGAAATIALVSLTVVSTMGLAGWAGATLEAVSGFVPSVIMTVAVADSVHLLTSFYYELRRGKSQHDAIHRAMRVNLGPVFVTSITTMIGVLTLNFSDSPPYHDLGNLIALGVFIAFILSMSFLPALLSLIPVRAPERGQLIEQWMGRFG